jgi:acyl carrier protein
MSDQVEERVRTVLADVFGIKSADVGPDTSPDTIEQWDSLQHLSLVLAIEEEFDLQLGDDETTEIVTFPLIVETVREKLAAASDGTT